MRRSATKQLLRMMIEADHEATLEAFDSDEFDAALMANDGVREKILQRREEMASPGIEQPKPKQLTIDIG